MPRRSWSSGAVCALLLQLASPFVILRHISQELGSTLETTAPVHFPLSFHLLILHISDVFQIYALAFAS